jgi:hypothetical protein
MTNFLSAALASLLFLTGSVAGGTRPSTFRSLQEEGSAQEESGGRPAISHGRNCIPCPDDTNDVCLIKVRVNLFAGQTGMPLYRRHLQSLSLSFPAQYLHFCSFSSFIKGTMSLKTV